jgi:CP family cyanate transporter-like MFS transporter
VSTARVALAVVLLSLNLRTIFASLPPLLTDVRADLGLSATVAGLLLTLPVVCLGALAPLAPRLARRASIQWLLVACAALTGAGMGIRGLGSTAALFAGTLLAGAAVAIAQTLVPVLIRSRYPGHLGLLTGAFSMALTLSAALAAGLSVPLEHALGGGWEAALAVWALPALAAALVWLPHALREDTRVSGEAGPGLLRSPLAWSVAAFFGVQSAAFYAGLAWLPSVLRDHGYSAASAGGLLALASAVQFVPAFLVPVLAARSRNQAALLAVIVALGVTGVAGLLAAPASAGPWMVLLGLGQGGALGLALILPVLRGGDVPTVAALTAMTLCVGYLMAATGPWILGVARDLSGGWDVPLTILLALLAAQLLVGAAAVRDRSVAGVQRTAAAAGG